MIQKLRFALSGLLMIPMLSLMVAVALPSPQAHAACQERILGFPTWFAGLTDGDCEIKKIGNEGMPMEEFVTRVALNIVEMILVLVGYAAAIMLIVGGFNYMTSQGDSGKMSSAKNTITNALIGLAISIFSVAIVNFVAEVV